MYPDLDLNQGLDLRRVGHRREAVVYNPLHHRDKEPTTGFAPALAAQEANTVKTGA